MLGEIQVKRIDQSSVYKDYEGWPRHSEVAYRLKANPPPTKEFRQIIFAGMGGSATAGDIVQDWLSDQLAIPIHVIKDSRLPEHVGPDSLVLGVSVSGDTEETILAIGKALLKKATLSTISSGGQLAKLSKRKGISFTRTRRLLAPRTSLPYVLFPAIKILQSLRVVKGGASDVHDAINALYETRRHVGVKVDASGNISKQIALMTKGTYPVIFSSGFIKSAATRFKNSLNETAKTHAVSAILPEACHNEIVAWTPAKKLVSAVFLRLKNEPGEARARFEAFKEIIKESKARVIEVFGFGESRLAQLVSLIYLLDYAALYRAVLDGIDPLPTPQIDSFKQRLRYGRRDLAGSEPLEAKAR